MKTIQENEEPKPFKSISGLPEAERRDRFAAAALTGMLAHRKRYRPRPEASPNWHEAIAEEAYQIADKMMTAMDVT